MTAISPDDIILSRLRRELHGASNVALGEGLPRLVVPHLNLQTKTLLLSQHNGSRKTADAVVIEARQVSTLGDLVMESDQNYRWPEASRWIVATRHTHSDDDPKLVAECTLPVTLPRCIQLVITELGVIEITEVGLVLKELAPGVSSDDVKMKTRASLHVADDIRLMEI